MMIERAINFDRAESVVSVFVPGGPVVLPADTFTRLDEWARWSRGGFGGAGRCASAEGRYDSRYPCSKREVVVQPDLQSVLAVERVVCTRLPRLAREIVKRHFVYASHPLEVARTLGIQRFQYGNELRRSVLMVKNNLTRGKTSV